LFSFFVVSAETLYSFIEKCKEGSRGHYRCKLCGILTERRFNMWRHVENIHFPGTNTYTCQHCGEVLTTRTALDNHATKYHSKV
jgi:predicted SprT family Zn-dependent metalloprotease